MAGRYLLDTDTAIELLAADLAPEKRVAIAAKVFVSITVLAELFYGAERSQLIGENITRVERFADRFYVLPCDIGTARAYGKIKKTLRVKGGRFRKTTSGSPRPRCSPA